MSAGVSLLVRGSAIQAARRRLDTLKRTVIRASDTVPSYVDEAFRVEEELSEGVLIVGYIVSSTWPTTRRLLGGWKGRRGQTHSSKEG